VSGVIKKIYVDYNSIVKQGELLAELDKTPLLVQLNSSRADLESATSQLTYQEANYKRFKEMLDKKAVSETDFETALYQYSIAKANVDKMKAQVEKAQTDLDYAMIYSPISGVVLSRAVNEGQTVAASFNTPTLFTIAQDLTKMQVEANVDEADIGQVMDGQNVDFTVDAFPGEVFKGTVTQIRLKPVTNANVVTYSVVISAPNPDLKLKPGLTASITAYTHQVKDVLVIPAKALRFKPDSATLAEYFPNGNQSKSIGIKRAEGQSSNWKRSSEQTGDGKSKEGAARKEVWIKSGDSIHPAFITTGMTDEINTEVINGLKKGDEVIVGITKSITAKAETSNGISSSPFMPKRPGSTKK
jgi:HlyD family secretion protein